MVTAGNIIVGLNNVKVGAYGAAEGSCIDLGATEGGFTPDIPREYFEKTCDQVVGILGLYKTKEKCSIKFVLAECTLENLARAMGYPDAAVSNGVLSFGGGDDTEYKTLFINVPGPNGGTRQYHFWKVVFISGATHSYKKGDKTMIECEVSVMQDTTQTTDQQLGTITDTGADTTAPTIIMTTPAPAGTVTKLTTNPIVLTITEANPMNENTIVYGDNDGATIQVLNLTTPGSEVLVAGSISYNSVAKTITFTPTVAWDDSDILLVVVSTGLADSAGNHLASTYLGHLTVTA